MLPGLLRLSLASPREGAAWVLGLRLPLIEAASAVVLVAALGGVVVGLATGGQLVLPLDGTTLVMGPLGYAALLGLCLLIGAVTLAGVGRALGGTGTAVGALALAAWLQAIDLVLQAVVAVVAMLAPPLAVPVALAALAAFIWVAIGFVRELHGVPTGRAVAILILAVIALGMALAILLSLGPWSLPDA